MPKQTVTITVIIVYILIHALFIEPNTIRTRRYEIENNNLSGVRVAFLSDLHLKKNDYNRLDRIAKLTDKQEPDILLIGGDLARFPNKNMNMNMTSVATKLGTISARKKYAILGDDDWATDHEEIRKELEKNKIIVLENSPIRTFVKNRYVDIVGIKDPSQKDVNIVKAMKKTRSPRIVITHNPDVYYDIIDEVALILAGHTHGGQIVVGLPLFVRSKYGSQFASGLKTPRGDASNPIIISRGLGTDKLPFRLNCPPEIVIVDFVNKK